MRHLPPLSSLRAFEAAARHESFKLAAEELSVTPTAISHQIRSLEEIIGLQLFERQTRKVTMTMAARQIYPALHQGFDLFAQALQPFIDDAGSASITVSTTTAFASHWLMPRLSAFHAMHPQITLSVLANNDPVNLETGQADLAIRLFGTPPATEAGTALFQDRLTVMAAPGFRLSSLHDLKRVRLISYDWHHAGNNRPDWQNWFEAAGVGGMEMVPHLHFNEESHALEAAIAGQGIALLSQMISSDALQRGLLETPFDAVIAGQFVHLLRSRRRRNTTSLITVENWLLDQLQLPKNP